MNSLEPVVSKALKEVKSQKDFMRNMATKPITELSVKKPLIENEAFN